MKYGIFGSSVYVSGNPSKYVIAGLISTPYVAAYPWSNSTGWGTKYSNPATIGIGSSYSTDLNPIETAIVVSHASSPFISAWIWSSTTGWGTKYSAPGTIIATSGATKIGYSTRFSPDGNAIAIMGTASPFVNAYAWTNASGFGSKFANPTVVPSSYYFAGTALDFLPNGSGIVLSQNTTVPYAIAFSSSTGFGTKYTDLAALAGIVASTVAFQDSSLVGMQIATSPWISVVNWSSGWGTKYSNPVTASTNYATASASTKTNSSAYGGSIGTAARMYPISGGAFGTPYTASSTYVASTATISFGTDDNVIFYGSNTTPFLFAYPFSNTTGFGTRYTDISTTGLSQGFSISIGSI